MKVKEIEKKLTGARVEKEIRNILSKIWDEIVLGGHFTSISAVCIVWLTSIIVGVGITWDFVIAVYLLTQLIYLYNRKEDIEEDLSTNKERTKHIRRYLKLIPILGLIFFFTLVFVLVFNGRFFALIFVIFMLLLGLLYSKWFKDLTKKISGFKSYYVSLVWALLVPLFAVAYSMHIAWSIVLITIFVFIRAVFNTSSCDYKDIKSDKKSNLKTLPIVLGQKKFFVVLNMISVLSVIPIIIGITTNTLPFYSIFLIFSCLYSLYYLQLIKKSSIDPKYLYNVLIEGEAIVWVLLVLFGNYLLPNAGF